MLNNWLVEAQANLESQLQTYVRSLDLMRTKQLRIHSWKDGQWVDITGESIEHSESATAHLNWLLTKYDEMAKHEGLPR